MFYDFFFCSLSFFFSKVRFALWTSVCPSCRTLGRWTCARRWGAWERSAPSASRLQNSIISATLPSSSTPSVTDRPLISERRSRSAARLVIGIFKHLPRTPNPLLPQKISPWHIHQAQYFWTLVKLLMCKKCHRHNNHSHWCITKRPKSLLDPTEDSVSLCLVAN